MVTLGYLLLPACGLVVGFTPKETCEADCEDANSETSSGFGGDANTISGSETTNSTSASGATTTSNTTSAEETSSSTSSSAATSTTSSTSSSTSTTSSTTSNGGSGGTTDSSSTSTNAATTDGSTSGDGGSGGSTTTEGTGGTSTTSSATTGDPTACAPILVGNASNATGQHPADVALVPAAATRGWALGWLASDTVYYRFLNSDGSERLAETPLTTTAAVRSAPKLAAVGTVQATAAYGEFVSPNAGIALSEFTAVAPTTNPSSDSSNKASGGVPLVGGVAPRGNTHDTLVAALEADGSGWLTMFSSGTMMLSQGYENNLTAITAVSLGSMYFVYYVKAGNLMVATTTAAAPLSTLDPEPALTTAATTPSALAAVAVGSGVALAWVNADHGISLALLNQGTTLGESVVVSESTNASFPHLVADGTSIAVAWLDNDAGALYLRRFSTDLKSSEVPVTVATGAANFDFGLAVDGLTNSAGPTYGLIYSTDRLKFSLVSCFPE